MQLPPPEAIIQRSLYETLRSRRSIREFSQRTLEWKEISALLWAGLGVSEPRLHLRTTPSAGALYPLELDVIVQAGVFRYDPLAHALRQRTSMDVRVHLSSAALHQASVSGAPSVFVISAVPARTARRYGARGARYIEIEAGHVAQNMLMVATSLGLAGVPVGAFEDGAVHATLHLSSDETPLYLIPIGWPHDRESQHPGPEAGRRS